MKTRSGASLDARRILPLLLCLGVGIWFWDSPVFKPLKLLVVMMHESGHALATLLVGGSVDHISIRADQSGQCLSLMPPGIFGQIFVYSAGYVGSAVAGAGLLLATLRFNGRRWILGAACLWLAVMGLLYARDAFTLLFCFVTAVVMGASAKWLPEGVVDVVNLFIAAFSGLYVVFDLRDDLWDSAVRHRSDAALLAELTFVPALVWAALWTALALAILGLSVWLSVRPDRRLRLSPRATAGAASGRR